MSVSKLFTAEEAYRAAVLDYSAAMAASLAAVHSRTISAAEFDEYLLDLLSARYGEHIERGELHDYVPMSRVHLATHVERGIEL